MATVAGFQEDGEFLPKSGTDTSRVGALYFLQNPLVLRCVLYRLIFRHDCCVYPMALATPAHSLTLTAIKTDRLNNMWPLGVALELPETQSSFILFIFYTLH